MKILYVKNNSERAKEFQLKTIIYEENSQKYVKKQALCKEAIPHLKKMKESYEKLSASIINPNIKLAKIINETEDSLTFEFIEGISLEKTFNEAKKRGKQETDKVINDYMALLKKGFKTTQFDSSTMVTDAYIDIFGDLDYSKLDGKVCFESISNIDLIFSNIIFNNNDIYLIDYEWVFDLPICIDFIKYRALPSQNTYYKKLENNFLNHIVIGKYGFFQLQNNYLKPRLTVEQQLQQKEELIQQKEELIQQKEEQIQEKEQQIQSLLSMVDSMRLKNRFKNKIKKIIPTHLHSHIKKGMHHIKQKEFLTLFEKIFIKLKRKLYIILHNSSIGSNSSVIMDLSDKNILYVFPVIDWKFRIQRPQQLSKEFQNNKYQVIYFSTKFNIGEKPGFTYEKIDNNILIVTLFLNENKNIYTEKLTPSNIDFLLKSILKLEQVFCINKRISIIDHPFWIELANKLSGKYTIYDCMDYHAGFGDESSYLLELEEESMSKSDLLILTSEDLYSRFSKENHNSILVRNGCEYSYFNTVPSKTMHYKEGKTVGYYGAISNWFDTELVASLAKRLPDYEFILVGSTYGCEDINLLKNIKNITLVGEVDYIDLTKYLYAFDIAIMPFKINQLTMATNPVKIYEYLSAGKPVVSTKLPEVKLMGEVVYLATDVDDFEKAIIQALDENNIKLQKQRMEFAKNNDWTSRFNTISTTIATSKQKKPQISIIIVTYNNLEITKACLSSMEKYNNYENCEIIIVDNLSTDGTRDYLTSYCTKHKHIKCILHNENSGFAAGNNIGIKEASGEYIILLNNDTYVTPNWIQNLIHHFDIDNTIGMVGPRTNNIGNEARMETYYNSMDEMINLSYSIYYNNREKQYDINVLAFFCVAIKREVIETVGLLDEIFGIGMFEDDDYCIRTKNAGYKLICADDVFIHHHLGASFNKNPEWKEKLFKKNKAIFEKRYGKWIPHKYREEGK